MVSKKLSELSSGEKGKIAGILEYKNEFECMGLYPDMRICVMTRNPSKGPCIIKTEKGQREIVMKRYLAVHINIDTE